MLLCPNKGFLEQHSSTRLREKDKIRVQNDGFAGNGKSQDEFIILGATCKKIQTLVWTLFLANCLKHTANIIQALSRNSIPSKTPAYRQVCNFIA